MGGVVLSSPTPNDIKVLSKVIDRESFNARDVYFGVNLESHEVAESLERLEDRGFIEKLSEKEWIVLSQEDARSHPSVTMGLITLAIIMYVGIQWMT